MNFPPHLPSYIFSTQLGKGTYARVYKAFRKEGAREVVAIKCISKKILNKKASDNLINEIGILKKVKHDHIVQLLDFSWDSQYIYIILEFCPGGDLSKFIRQNQTLPEQVVKHFLQQLGLALHCLFQQNVVHMDLKPQNILLSSSDNPILKLADFGFAQHMERPIETMELRGSPLYMAPEIFISGAYSPKCDLWSVGVILYECIYGSAPFTSSTYDELKTKIRDTSPVSVPSHPQVSDFCSDLLTRLLQRDPAKRIDHKNFFDHPFVDLKYAPTAECLSKANELLDKAIQFEKRRRFHKAYGLYTEGLTYLIAAVKYERNSKLKDELRQRVEKFMEHVENLAAKLDSTNKNGSNAEPISSDISVDEQDSSDQNIKLLKEMFADSPVLLKGIIDMETFHLLVTQRKYDAAIQLFEKIFESTYAPLADEPNVSRKKLYFKEIEKGLSKAEDIKEFVRSRKRIPRIQSKLNEKHESKCGIM